MRPLLLGRGGPWPLAGHFRGRSTLAGVSVSWAGRVAADAGLDAAWAAAGVVHRALSRDATPGPDRRRAVAGLWDRLAQVEPARLGPAAGADLHLLVVAEDPDGVAVSAVGLAGLFGVAAGRPVEPWVTGQHPLLGPPGLPSRRPGALTAPSGPPWLVGVAPGGPTIQGEPAERVLARSGVDPRRGAA